MGKKRLIKKSELDKMVYKRTKASLRDYSGLTATSTKGGGGTLTMEAFEKAWKYIGSKEFAKIEQEKAEMLMRGQMIISFAYNQGVINETEAVRLGWSLSLNGALIVSPEMYKRLKKVRLTERDDTN